MPEINEAGDDGEVFESIEGEEGKKEKICDCNMELRIPYIIRLSITHLIYKNVLLKSYTIFK